MNRKVTAGLADYVEGGTMTPQGIQTASQILMEYQDLMKNLGFDQPHVFATASLRNISNTEDAVAQLQRDTGLSVDVLSGAEEARLSYLGAVGPTGPNSGLLIDLGGGSTELVHYREGQILSSCSLPLGSLSLFSQYVAHLHPTRKERKAIRAHIREQLDHFVPAPPSIPQACGVGGTARAACKVANRLFGRPQNCHTLSAQELRRLLKTLKKPDHDHLHLLLKAAPDRIHTLIPGLLVLDTVAQAYQLQEILVSSCGVREGYLHHRVLKGEAG